MNPRPIDLGTYKDRPDTPQRPRTLSAGERPLPKSAKPKKLDDLIINDDLETPSLTDPNSGRMIITNAVGKRIIELADGSHTIDHIAHQLFEEFEGAEPDDIRNHTEDFLRAAATKGLVSWS